MRSDLEDVLVAIDLSRKTFQRIRLNYVWALGYNVVMIPVAAGLLYPTLRMQIPPWIAGTLGLLVAADVLCRMSAMQKGPGQQVHASVCRTRHHPLLVGCCSVLSLSLRQSNI